MNELALFPHDERPKDVLTIPRATQACASCKKQKRKCDKQLPACGLCKKMTRPCDYTDIQVTPTAEDFAAMKLKLRDLEQRLNQQGSSPPIDQASSNTPPSGVGQAHGLQPAWAASPSRFPSALFLDMDLFKMASMSIPKSGIDIPMVSGMFEAHYALWCRPFSLRCLPLGLLIIKEAYQISSSFLSQRSAD